MKLRPYQEAAVQATVQYFRKHAAPGCLVLPTGAGKSLIIAELCRLARGKVLVVAHVKELCDQNYRKMIALDHPAGIYCAGLEQKNPNEKVTFCSVQSLAPNLADFADPISLLIIDECHRVGEEEDSQYRKVMKHLRDRNPRMKILGLTATPYRLDMGWCYRHHARGVARTAEPRPFETCIFEITLQDLLRGGYLTPPAFRAPENWEALLAKGKEGEKRATALISRDIVETTKREERRGVMIFAATAEHAKEVLSHLPADQAALVLGESSSPQRDAALEDFRKQQLRYLVNVAVLTTGFDAPHVDFIALLRKTESVSLFQQIVGRGLRLFENKRDCLVIDYAKNGFDLFAPEVGEPKPHADAEVVLVSCPACGGENEFWGQKDSAGHVLEHYGRRCKNLLQEKDERPPQRCSYRFVFKECPQCSGENDIAARACGQCGRILVDPDELLERALKEKDTVVLRVAGVQYLVEGERLRLVYHDEDGQTVSERFDFSRQPERAAFNRVYSRRLAGGRRPLELISAEQAEQLQHLMPRPDFVIAKKRRGKRRGVSYLAVERRIFQYSGAYRTAASAN